MLLLGLWVRILVWFWFVDDLPLCPDTVGTVDPSTGFRYYSLMSGTRKSILNNIKILKNSMNSLLSGHVCIDYTPNCTNKIAFSTPTLLTLIFPFCLIPGALWICVSTLWSCSMFKKYILLLLIAWLCFIVWWVFLNTKLGVSRKHFDLRCSALRT